MELEVIEREINEGRATLVEEGRAGKCHIVECDGVKFFHKEYLPIKDEPEVSEARAIFNNFKFRMPSTCYIDYKVTAEQKAEKEFSTIQNWNLLNIPAPKPIAYEGSRLVYEFMPGNSFATTFDGNDLKDRDFGCILDCFHKIRNVAKEVKNVDILHSDPILGNFFYNLDRNVIVPIDPEKIIVREDFNITDGRINLFFLCNIFRINTKLENQVYYLRQSVDRFTRKERQVIAELNTDPIEAREYFKSQGTKLGADRLRIYYSRENLDFIEKALVK